MTRFVFVFLALFGCTDEGVPRGPRATTVDVGGDGGADFDAGLSLDDASLPMCPVETKADHGEDDDDREDQDDREDEDRDEDGDDRDEDEDDRDEDGDDREDREDDRDPTPSDAGHDDAAGPVPGVDCRPVDPMTPTTTPTFGDVWPILSAECGCHDEGRAGLTLATELQAYDALVGTPSNANGMCSGGTYVTPGDPERSILYRKVSAIDLCGARMPRGGQLAQHEIDLIRAWIASGAVR